ncbi:MAG: PQQ-dependent sugar dehydrogenase [Saprospiraceae bacterium]|nr:PQQ-dependent sugar dehydrogenase [Saprospiraceae bacterium]
MICSLLLINCKNTIPGEKPLQDAPLEISTGVEMLPPEAKGQNPAFPGQTRISAVKTRTIFKVDTLAKNLDRPWGLAFLPDGRYLVTEKPGRVRIVNENGTLGDSIKGILPIHFQQDGGLMDIAIAPDFSESREVFWSYSEKIDTGFTPTIARAYLSEDEKSLTDVTVIYRAGPAVGSVMHYGTSLLFDPEGHLLVSFGERFEPRVRVRAQKLNSAFGKIIRIDREGNPAPGNPFASTADTLPEIWAYGFRDPQGLAFHGITGELWASDHGARAGDEINHILPGANYGWPMIAYGLEYSREPVNGGLTQADGMQQPVYYWDPAVAPAGICFYSGQLIPEWQNDLFVACLRGKHLIRLKLDGKKVTGEERLLTNLDKRLRGVKEGPDGALYVWTDEADGYILRISNETYME